jgi:ribosomal protein S18 acetylase RimI-like enzyme
LSRVALAGGNIVGAALCGHDGRRGFIYHLAVAPALHGRGIGRLLVDECIARLRRAGIARAIILVAMDNQTGRTFWSVRDGKRFPGPWRWRGI